MNADMKEKLASVAAKLGNTPIVDLGDGVFGKDEGKNPAGSIKDRAAFYILKDGLESGALREGAPVVEATSGNTGIGLAYVGGLLGIKVVLTMPESMSEERRKMLADYGAELVLTPASEGMGGAVAAAKRIVEERGGFFADQFGNPSSIKAHFETTAPEIFRDLPDTIAVVAGVGSGGTVMGIKKYIVENGLNCKVYAVEPAESPLLSEGYAAPHLIQGIGANFVPAIVDKSALDGIVTVKSAEAVAEVGNIFRIFGLRVGISAGAAVLAARAVAEPPTDVATKGPREGFTEDVKTNTALVRKRLKTGELEIEFLTVGKRSRTAVAVCSLKGVSAKGVKERIVQTLSAVSIDTVPDASFLARLLSDRKHALLKQLGTTEKPDILCAKMLEGRIAVLVDGSPIVLTLPYLLAEDFQSAQDYFVSPYRATASRWLRMGAACIAVFLPAFYVAAELFRLRLLPFDLLMTVAGGVRSIPLSPGLELFFLLLVLEVLIEASVRMPKYVALALSVIGALVLGDTAVKAGLVSSPAIIIVALSGISAYTVPDLTGTLSLVRLAFIVAAGSIGTYGILLLAALLAYYLVTTDSYGVPLLAPFSPLIRSDLKDTLFKAELFSLWHRPRVLRGKNERRLASFGKEGEEMESEVEQEETKSSAEREETKGAAATEKEQASAAPEEGMDVKEGEGGFQNREETKGSAEREDAKGAAATEKEQASAAPEEGKDIQEGEDGFQNKEKPKGVAEREEMKGAAATEKEHASAAPEEGMDVKEGEGGFQNKEETGGSLQREAETDCLQNKKEAGGTSQNREEAGGTSQNREEAGGRPSETP